MKIIKWSIIFVLFTLLLTNCGMEGFDIILPRSTEDTGQGGSLNKFAVVGDFLYVLDKTNIKTFKLDNGTMSLVGNTHVSEDIETLHPFNNFLLIGARTGMSIYEIGETGKPVFVSDYSHVQACDPVVTDGEHAFVTLSTGTLCNTVNRLDVLDVSNILHPSFMISYPMFNPKGLGVDGDLLFICDSEEGLKIYDKENVLELQLIKQFDNFNAVDVIPYHGNLLVVTTDALHQFDYSDPNNIFEISSININ